MTISSKLIEKFKFIKKQKNLQNDLGSDFSDNVKALESCDTNSNTKSNTESNTSSNTYSITDTDNSSYKDPLDSKNIYSKNDIPVVQNKFNDEFDYELDNESNDKALKYDLQSLQRNTKEETDYYKVEGLDQNTEQNLSLGKEQIQEQHQVQNGEDLVDSKSELTNFAKVLSELTKLQTQDSKTLSFEQQLSLFNLDLADYRPENFINNKQLSSNGKTHMNQDITSDISQNFPQGVSQDITNNTTEDGNQLDILEIEEVDTERDLKNLTEEQCVYIYSDKWNKPKGLPTNEKELVEMLKQYHAFNLKISKPFDDQLEEWNQIFQNEICNAHGNYDKLLSIRECLKYIFYHYPNRYKRACFTLRRELATTTETTPATSTTS